MTVQEFIAGETERAMEALLHQVKRLPGDKVDWQPNGEGRSALDQLQECAVIATYYPSVLGSLKAPEIDAAEMARFNKRKAELDTVEKAESALRESTGLAVAAIRAVLDADLDKEMSFFGPFPWKVASVMNAHAWNMHWHTGQVCYIQTLLGDKEMG